MNTVSPRKYDGVVVKKINWWLIGILGFIVLLRIPSWFEPHWYGDEEIYLVLGQMVRKGAVLYRDIWDNKTPLLYLIYAISPTLLWAKLTATLAVLGTTLGSYFMARKIFEDKPNIYLLLSTALVGIFLSLPILEGTIANAELYFVLPTVLGAILIYRLLTTNYRLQTSIWIGLLASIAFLLKVPAVFDFIGLFVAFFCIKIVEEYHSPIRNYRKLFKQLFSFFLPIGIAFLIPVIFFLLYFFLTHGLNDFIIAAFSQNAFYVAVGSGPLSKLSNPLFIKGLILAIGCGLLAVGYLKRLLSRELILLTFWFGFSLYGALLSNRPYMHYLLQIIPSATLLFVYLVAHFRRFFFIGISYFILLLLIAKMFRGAFALNTFGYYQNFFAYASEQKSWTEYANSFDPRVTQSYQAAFLIRQNTNANDPIFVWGDAAAIYDLSDRPAVTKFIQAHHLTTINGRNYDLIIGRLLKFQPKIIVVTRPVQFPFMSLELLIHKNYQLLQTIGNLYIYKSTVFTSSSPWKPQPI